jgi:hypothetical protein
MYCNSVTLKGSKCKKIAISQGLCKTHQPKCNFPINSSLFCKRKVKNDCYCYQHQEFPKYKKTYNIVIFGKGGTGKSSYMKCLQKQNLEKGYIADWEITQYKIERNDVIFNFKILPGQRLHVEYDFENIDAVIVFVTVENTPLFSRETLDNFNKINEKYNLPCIIVNNIFNNYSKSKILKTTLPIFNINVIKNENLTEPLDYLVNTLK